MIKILPLLFFFSLPIYASNDDIFSEEELLEEEVLIDLEKTEEQTQVFSEEEINAMHEELYLEHPFPSAQECRVCHEEHYRQWSVSQHAYALVSPVFNAMHGKTLKVTNGTNGDFCIRCHTPIGMTNGEPLFTEYENRHPVSQEGVTCAVCHRVNEDYGKVSGRLSLRSGEVTEPINGPTDGEELKRVLEDPDTYGMVADPSEPGRKGHREVASFFAMTRSSFCASCHDVTHINNFRLEEAFSEFKNSPAAKRGVSCQDCHMGKVPGKDEGYHEGPAAVVGGEPTRTRKRTMHYWAGPDHSVVHPGIFPFHPEAKEFASIQEWLAFDHEANWGSAEFEDAMAAKPPFPARWDSVDDRIEARRIIEENKKLLAWADEQRYLLMRNGFGLSKIEVDRASSDGIDFRVAVVNKTDGHSAPTGFDAERVIWLHVAVQDAEGNVVMESGDLDPNGDVRDLHSLYVHHGELPLDRQLFSLQSRFLVRTIRGGEREQVLPLNVSADPLLYLRRSGRPNILTGRPAGARKHKQGISPLAKRWAEYHVDAEQLTGRGPYTIKVELKAGMVPVNLIAEIADVGIDFGMSPREVADRVVEAHMLLWEKEREVEVRHES